MINVQNYRKLNNDILLFYTTQYVNNIIIHVPVAPAGMEFENQELFLKGDVPTSNIWTQVVQPS